MHDHGGAVANQDGINSGAGDDPGHERVVGREDNDGLSFPPGAGEISDGLHAAFAVSAVGIPAGRWGRTWVRVAWRSGLRVPITGG